jgi:hypothetical protein
MTVGANFETDAAGNIVTRPVLGWTTAPAAGMAVIVKLDYAETPQELQTGGRSLQVILTPQQALELAEILTTQAKRVLNAPSPPPQRRN